jgi:hypothetical protein
MLPKFQFILFDADFVNPSFLTSFFPLLKTLESDFFIIFYEIFYFHLIEFSHSKHEVPRSDFISESLSRLSDAKWYPDSHGIQDVFEIDENPLRGFWSQVDVGSFAFNHSLLGFEHQIEFFWF